MPSFNQRLGRGMNGEIDKHYPAQFLQFLRYLDVFHKRNVSIPPGALKDLFSEEYPLVSVEESGDAGTDVCNKLDYPEAPAGMINAQKKCAGCNACVAEGRSDSSHPSSGNVQSA